jgi:chromosomal replication initiator protein
MNNTFTNKNLNNLKSEKLDWSLIQTEMKNKLGLDIYESWLKKIIFVEEFQNYILLSVPTRFIRDWITSRYLDQILQSIRNYKKEIIRIEFKISGQKIQNNQENPNLRSVEIKENISFIKDSYLQYNRIDPNK